MLVVCFGHSVLQRLPLLVPAHNGSSNTISQAGARAVYSRRVELDLRCLSVVVAVVGAAAVVAGVLVAAAGDAACAAEDNGEVCMFGFCAMVMGVAMRNTYYSYIYCAVTSYMTFEFSGRRILLSW